MSLITLHDINEVPDAKCLLKHRKREEKESQPSDDQNPSFDGRGKISGRRWTGINGTAALTGRTK